MPSITITWNAINDAITCPICRALHNHEWTFVTPDPMPNELTYNGQIVWNTAVGSQAHGHQNFNCRCSIHPRIDLSDVKAKLETLKEEIEAANEQPR